MQFFPSNSILASDGANATLTVTLTATTGTPGGTTTVSIDATSTDAGQKTLSQPISVTVTRSPDFSLAVNSPASPAVGVGQTISLAGNVIALNGYANTVQLSCVAASTAPPATCGFNPAALNSSVEGAAFNLAASSKAPGTYSFNVQAVGGDASSITHTEPLTLTFFDIAIAANPLSQTVSAGQNAVYSLTLTPQGLSILQQAVTYSCGSLPALTSCSFNPSQIPSGNSATQVTLTIANHRDGC